MSNKGRNSFLDITRIVAVLAVIMIHTSSGFASSYDTSSIEFLWGNFFNSISRIGVPLFVMISGSLMLDEDKNIKIESLFSKKIKNIVCLLIFWSAFYCSIYEVIFPLIKGEALHFPSILVSLGTGHYHIWYLYMIIGLYLITPFLREFVKKENKQLVLLFIAVALATQFTLPVLNAVSTKWGGGGNAAYLIEFIEKFYLGFFGDFTAYYLIGWYIVHIGIKKKWKFYCLGIFSLLAIIIYVQMTKDSSNGYSNMNILVLLYSVSVFTALNSSPGREPAMKNKKILEGLSNLCFGVYIIHPLCQTVVVKVLIYNKNPFIYILCYFGMVAVLSFAVCLIASKLPVIKKAFRM